MMSGASRWQWRKERIFMGVITVRGAWLSVVVAALAAGCSGDNKGGSGAASGEPVREAFEAFQKALKDKDADKIWDLLDADSQADVDRRAKRIREEYAKASAAGKAEQE